MTNPLRWLRNALFGRRADTAPEQNAAPIAPESSPPAAALEGTQRGWLRILPATRRMRQKAALLYPLKGRSAAGCASCRQQNC